MDKLEKIVADAKSAFERVADLAQLEQTKARFLGKTGALTEQLKGLGKLAAGNAQAPARRSIGQRR
jgi:phenylalanyl-tRNA synthetase alpha chain